MKKFRLFVAGLIFAFAFMITTNAYTDISSTAKKYYPGTYFNELGSSNKSFEDVTSSSLVSKTSTIPSDYSFSLGYVGSKFDSRTINAGVPLSDEQKAIYITGEKKDTSAASGFLDKDGNLISYITLAKDSIKNKYSVRYDNAGKYNGKVVDVKLTVVDFETFDASGNGSSNDGVEPMIAFGSNRISINVLSVAWIKVKYDFYLSGTNTPISVMGRTSYWDVDNAQGILFENNNTGIYSTNDSALKIMKLDGNPYVFYLSDESSDDDRSSMCSVNLNQRDTKGVITETFSGSTMTRLFSYSMCAPSSADTVATAAGAIVHESAPFGAFKSYDENTKAGSGSSPVKVGDVITYNIDFANTHDTNQTVVVTDILSKGLEYVSNSSKLLGDTSSNASVSDPKITKNDDGTTTLVWSLNVEATTDNTLKYSVKVNDSASIMVSNKATVKVGNDPLIELSPLKNPVPVKEYSTDTPSGANGALVKVNDIINYSIKYANPFQTSKIKVVITDTMSKGLEYVSGSTKINGKEFDDPKITKNDDGTTTLVWSEELPANAERELIYSAKVVGGVDQVENTATVKFGNFDEYQLEKLINPLEIIK